MSAELLDAAREYAIANDRYGAACLRLAMARGVENVPAEEWDADTLAACRAVNDAQEKLTSICTQMFPQSERKEVWKEYSARFWPEPPFCTRCNRHHAREGEAEEKCQEVSRFVGADHRRRGGTV